ncbi:MAG: AIR synthase-related protein, partial [Pseudomonadota bacterium]
VPTVFNWIQETGGISDTEMDRTFNMGIGMVLAVPKVQLDSTLAMLSSIGEDAWIIGELSTT